MSGAADPPELLLVKRTPVGPPRQTGELHQGPGLAREFHKEPSTCPRSGAVFLRRPPALHRDSLRKSSRPLSEQFGQALAARESAKDFLENQHIRNSRRRRVPVLKARRTFRS